MTNYIKAHIHTIARIMIVLASIELAVVLFLLIEDIIRQI
jgi:hypothetical protein